MVNTPKFGVLQHTEGGSSGEIVANDAQNVFDTFTSLNIKDRDLTSPPGSPAEGDAYIVGGTGSGAWLGQDNDVAYYFNGWLFLTPFEGLRAYIADEDVTLVHNGTDWLGDQIQYTLNLSSPTASEDRTIVYLEKKTRILELNSVLVGATSLDWNLRNASDRSAAGTAVLAADHQTTSTTTVDSITSFSDANLEADTFLWFESSAVSGPPTEFHLTIRAALE